AQASVSFGKALRWWEKSLQPNMIEINSAQELVDSLLNAGDRLVIVDFYSPGCGGCKALHPKICQLAELNPDAVFLKVDYEQHKAMCYALHVHVLPFFRFYRGADGRVCSFSCTNATIKKFKDALAKHGTERCSLGPAKGLDESELLALASIGQISRSTAPKPTEEEKVEDLVLQETAKSSTAFIKDDSKIAVEEGNAMAMA
ncbi:UNVERIFIED_CONTAM: Thioredoxin-like 1-2, chloroplastic, partial [Sesamum indicum]